MEKIYVLDRFATTITWCETSIEFAITQIQNLKTSLEENGWKNIILTNTEYETLVNGYRIETDEEFGRRIKKEAAEKTREERQLEKDRKKYEELKTKFENE